MSSSEHEFDTAQIPEDLPPVQPPSAGFIIQLFVVPGLIVMAIVGVYLIFGKLATGGQDWREQVADLRHPNEHRRWRGGLGLAQILTADQELGAHGQQLSQNREIAQALAEMLAEELKQSSPSEPDLKYQAFLASTLGKLDLPEIVVPPLVAAMQPAIDREVRKNAIGSIAVMADRFARRNETLVYPGLSDEVQTISRDGDPLIRQLCAYTLGLVADEGAKSRLEVMLNDSDPDTRINAAIGLARAGDSRGISVFQEVLKDAFKPNHPEAAAEYEHFLALKNCIKAIEETARGFSDEQRKELIAALEPIAADYREPKIRVAAQSTLRVLKEAR
jgi:HEAT repeat protein